ncbi:MAG: hypothetical protein M9895_10750 [Aquamicrobium sp.]|uniref:hypothetical protein n=1 Tax=Aquamicrobium sp. TaxID=1872579 RepID=UPI00349E651C|nr:hypothetical protein [Aquamicrobium sp.]
MGKDNPNDRYALTALMLALFSVIALAFISQISSRYETEGGYQSVEEYSNKDIAQIVSALREFDPWEDTFAQWLMMGFAALATGVSYYAVRLLDKTLVVTRDAVRSSDDAVKVTRKIGRIQTRAYVHITKVKLTNAVGENPPAISVDYENFGQSHALRARHRMNVTFVFDDNEPNIPSEPQETKEHGLVLGPSQSRATTRILDEIGTFMLREVVAKGGAMLFVSGRITYDDAFKKRHFTTYKGRIHFGPDGLKDTDVFVFSETGNGAN